MRAFLVRLLEGWKRVAHWIGEKQATLIYTVLYLLVVAPIALLRRPFSDPFRYRQRKGSTFWVARPSRPITLDEARRQ